MRSQASRQFAANTSRHGTAAELQQGWRRNRRGQEQGTTWTGTRIRIRTRTAAVAQIMRRFVGSHEQAIWTEKNIKRTEAGVK